MKQEEPSDDQSTAAAIIIACGVIATATIVLMSFADKESTSLETWVYRYQTLITGFFAVAAAFVTVKQMQKTDAQSEKRHRELARLQVRSEKLRIERMIYPQFGKLRTEYKALKKLSLPVLIAIKSDEQKNIAFFEFADRARDLLSTADAIREIIKLEVWKDAEPLFGGVLRWDFEQLPGELTNLSMYAGLVRQYSSEQTQTRWVGDAWQTAETGFYSREKEILEADRAIDKVVDRLAKIFQHMYELADLYELGHHPRPSLDQL